MRDLNIQAGLQKRFVYRWSKGASGENFDTVTMEEPLEMKIAYGSPAGRSCQTMAITMRTPGQDADLFTGFLFTEGIIGQAQHVSSIRHVGQALDPSAKENVILAELDPGLPFDASRLSRHFYTSSSCGVCGKTSIELVQTVSCYFPKPAHPKVGPQILCTLPDKLRNAQTLFEHTGGIHAAGLFDASGQLLLLREDVGRHNALDKLIGAALSEGMIPLHNHILLLSGRISFELVQKAAMAGIPVIGAVGAPSSLAIELAAEHGMTLAGFLRPDRCNLYCDQNRFIDQSNIAYETEMYYK